MEYDSNIMAKMDYYELDYQRQLDIIGLTLALMRNLIQTRRDMIKKSPDILVLNLPELDEIRKVFEDKPLFTVEKTDEGEK